MHLDKRVAGLGAISLILSTLLILTIAGERADEPIEILENDYPKILSRGQTTFSLSLVARRDFETIQVQFTSATPVAVDVTDLVDPRREYGPGDEAGDVFDNMLKYDWFRNRTKGLGIAPESYSRSLTVGATDFHAEVVDYSSVMAYLVGHDATLGVPLVYIAMMNEAGDYHYLEGFSEFIVAPERNIKSLSISHNDNETKYVVEDRIREGSDLLPVWEAPRGILEFRQVKKDDTVTAIMTVEPLYIPSALGSDLALVQMMKIYLDGELYGDPIINVVRREVA